MFVDIVIACLYAGAWTGTLVLLWIFMQQANGLTLLHHYIRWKFVAWTIVMVCQSIGYFEHESHVFPAWMPFEGVVKLQNILFPAFTAYGSWRLVRDLLRPRVVFAPPKAVAQIRMDMWGKVVGWNPEATLLFGWTEEDMLNHELAELLIPESHREAHREGLVQFRATGHAPLLDTRYTQLALRKDGSTVLIDVSLTAHVTARGTIFLGTCSPAHLL